MLNKYNWIQRVLGGIVLWVAVLYFIDFLLFIIPGDIESYLNFSQRINISSTPGNLNKNFMTWLLQFLKGEWGHSLLYNISVRKILSSAMKYSILLGVSSFGISLFYALYLTILCLIFSRKNQLHQMIQFLLTTLICLSPMVICLVVFVLGIGVFNMSSAFEFQLIVHSHPLLQISAQMILPIISLTLIQIPYLFRIFYPIGKNEWKQNYIQHLLAWNISYLTIIRKHLLPKMMEPLWVNMGEIMASFMAGSFIVEMVFYWPGVSKILFEASLTQDRLLILACFSVTVAILILGNQVGRLLVEIKNTQQGLKKR